MPNSLIVGLGIGQLYKTVLKNLGHEVITVDPDFKKNANVPNIRAAILAYSHFDSVYICTPNFTHVELAKQILPYTRLMFIEKPGFKTSKEWSDMIKHHPLTRFMMVKNNMWRENINELKSLADKAITVNINWINKDRVPNPGTWFTTKELAYGGVSRDLMPHLLSLYIALNPDWKSTKNTKKKTNRMWELKDLISTDYGVVNANGTYDVDDECFFKFGNKWNLTTKWRSMGADQRNIEFVMPDGTVEVFELGLCPEDAYQRMIKDAFDNVLNNDYWKDQSNKDIWIHKKVENL
jgi:predicted dehydrogenase